MRSLPCLRFLILAPLSAFAVDGANPDSGKAGIPSKRPVPNWREAGVLCVRIIRMGAPMPFLSCTPPIRSRSDLDLAGLMIRCSESGAEVVIVVLPALPFRARPHVAFGKPGNEIKFEATVAPPGTVVLLPNDATTLVSGPWQALEDLFIRIDDDQSTIRGVVKLAGLEAGFQTFERELSRALTA